MNDYREKSVDALTGVETWRDYTPEEIKARKASEAETAQAAAAGAAATAKRESVLAALAEAAGLDIDEVKAALG